MHAYLKPLMGFVGILGAALLAAWVVWANPDHDPVLVGRWLATGETLNSQGQAIIKNHSLLTFYQNGTGTVLKPPPTDQSIPIRLDFDWYTFSNQLVIHLKEHSQFLEAQVGYYTSDNGATLRIDGPLQELDVEDGPFMRLSDTIPENAPNFSIRGQS